MKATEIMKKVVAGSALVAALAMAAPAHAQTKTDSTPASATAASAQKASPVTAGIEALVSSEEGKSYSRGHIWYELPGGVKAYTFIELYGDKKGYLGKTTLAKSLDTTFTAKAQIIQSNDYFTSAGLGIGAKIPMPKGMSASASIYPIYVGKDGVIADKIVAGYSIGAKLPHDMKIGSFGEINVGAKDGPKWSYGEASFTKSIWDHFEAGISIALRGQGKLTPKPEYRTSIMYKF